MNILSHSQASEAEIVLKFEDRTLSMEIRDNGNGFIVPNQLNDIVKDGHFGLIGMMERASLINASIEFTSSPGQGSKILVKFSGV